MSSTKQLIDSGLVKAESTQTLPSSQPEMMTHWSLRARDECDIELAAQTVPYDI